MGDGTGRIPQPPAAASPMPRSDHCVTLFPCKMEKMGRMDKVEVEVGIIMEPTGAELTTTDKSCNLSLCSGEASHPSTSSIQHPASSIQHPHPPPFPSLTRAGCCCTHLEILFPLSRSSLKPQTCNLSLPTNLFD